mgnify:CR=1 FL=1
MGIRAGGWIVGDPLTSGEAARAAYELVTEKGKTSAANLTVA